MPRNHESNDLDLVPIDTGASQPAKTPAPTPWPMPTFQPLEINNPLTYGQGKLPEDIRPDDPYAIFSLFFDKDTLQILVTHTNKYADLYPAPETPFARPWHPTTVKELRAYIGVYIWMGVHHESSIETYWSTNTNEDSIHYAVTKHISKNRW